MSKTTTCYTCKSAVHISDIYSEEGCPICGGEIHSPEVERVQLELEQSAKDQEKF